MSIAQSSPVYHDKAKSLAKALDLIRDAAKQDLDVTGHYARPDVFSFSHAPVGRR